MSSGTLNQIMVNVFLPIISIAIVLIRNKVSIGNASKRTLIIGIITGYIFLAVYVNVFIEWN